MMNQERGLEDLQVIAEKDIVTQGENEHDTDDCQMQEEQPQMKENVDNSDKTDREFESIEQTEPSLGDKIMQRELVGCSTKDEVETNVEVQVTMDLEEPSTSNNQNSFQDNGSKLTEDCEVQEQGDSEEVNNLQMETEMTSYE